MLETKTTKINIDSSREAIKAIALKLESLGVAGEMATNSKLEHKKENEIKMLIKLQEIQQQKLLDSQIKELEQKQFKELMAELEKINKKDEIFTNLKKQEDLVKNQEPSINQGLFDMVNIISETISDLKKQGIDFSIRTENLDNSSEKSSLLITINENQNLPNKNQTNQQNR
ncbi:MAG: hypothetical protein LW595_01010 [Rickettsiales bacterium]|nr:hypothetical protein [Rickettsiales bacterium]